MAKRRGKRKQSAEEMAYEESLQDPELRALDRMNWEKCRLQVIERASRGGHGPLSEVSGGPPGDVHHIDGRTKPMQNWDPEIREGWPHSLLNCILLTDAEHDWVGDNMRAARTLLWNRLLILYSHLEWGGKGYSEWLLNYAPFKRHFKP